MAEGEAVEVTIFGENYRIRSSDRSREQILCLARVVDGAMREVADGSPHLIASAVPVVAALNLADRLLSSRQQVEQLSAMLERQLEITAPTTEPQGADWPCSEQQ